VPVRVYIPTPFREHTGRQAYVTCEAATVADLLGRLADSFPALRPHVLTPDGAAPEHLNIYVNQVECRSLQAERTGLHDGDEVALVPAMAGGAQDDAHADAHAGAHAGAPTGAQDGAAPPRTAPLLAPDQLDRYSRHIRLDEMGVLGQRKLLDSRVLIVGAGALASPAAIYLAAAGVGTIGIVDGDRVDASNLQRQILHFTHNVGHMKVVSARRHIEDLNPDVRVLTFPTFLTSDNAVDIVQGFDLVINGSDNFPTRYLVNDVCVMLGKPLVDASILKWEGQATVFLPGRGCYRCLFPSPPPPGSVPSCAEGGVLGALAGHMGTLQAMEAVKVLLGIGEPLAGRLILFDALTGEYQTLRWQRNPACPVCGDHPTITELIDYEGFCGIPARAAEDDSLPAADAAAAAGWDLAPDQAAEMLRAGARLIDVREPYEYRHVRIAGAELLPLERIFSGAADLPRDQDLIFMCRLGERSALAVELARQAGITRAYNLAGGIVAWINEGRPVEQGAPAGGAR
jgi:molybdopterin/thiamine biosynthesis adenylyltransferase/rhodanese-related sulfurtransferase/molybdopterin converting factor small subunit